MKNHLKPLIGLLLVVSFVIFLNNCEAKNSNDSLEIYIPNEFAELDFSDTSSTWCFQRSKQSDHFIVFWAKGYGENNPNSSVIPEKLRVDIDDLLEKAEQFYDLNVNQLKFAEVGNGNSNLDKYKMEIFLFYQEEWMAFGAGYDDTVGALWVNPGTVQPVGSVIAHEIGHSFQYQVFCDLADGAGFRYGFGGNGGNGFWEQTAQWQAFQAYPEQVFGHHYKVYCNNYNKHICHEDYRYASYFIHYYWTDKHGIDFIGKLWRMAKEPEDPIQAYMKLTGITVDELNNEIYDAATKFVTWDIDALRELGAEHIGVQSYNYTTQSDNSYLVSYDRCPGTTGYNVIQLEVPKNGVKVSAAFNGVVNEKGFNQVQEPERAGWRYGYVALLEDGKRVYSKMNRDTKGIADFKIPKKCRKLWFVVTGAPKTYKAHAWDDDNKNDDQWPYSLRFTNTDIFGKIQFSGNEIPSDTVIALNVEFESSKTDYKGKSLGSSDIIAKIAKAFVLQPNEIAAKLGDCIKFYAVNEDGTLNEETTTMGVGHWFDEKGNVCKWGDRAKVYSELDKSNYAFTIGQYPGHGNKGDTYTIKQAMVYEMEDGKSVQAKIVFNIELN